MDFMPAWLLPSTCHAGDELCLEADCAASQQRWLRCLRLVAFGSGQDEEKTSDKMASSAAGSTIQTPGDMCMPEHREGDEMQGNLAGKEDTEGGSPLPFPDVVDGQCSREEDEKVPVPPSGTSMDGTSPICATDDPSCTTTLASLNSASNCAMPSDEAAATGGAPAPIQGPAVDITSSTEAAGIFASPGYRQRLMGSRSSPEWGHLEPDTLIKVFFALVVMLV